MLGTKTKFSSAKHFITTVRVLRNDRLWYLALWKQYSTKIFQTIDKIDDGFIHSFKNIKLFGGMRNSRNKQPYLCT